MTLTAKHEALNQAMAHLGEPPFDAIDTDPPGARLQKVLAQLDGRAGVEQWVLARRPWACAMRYATLSPSDALTPPWRFKYAFVLPTTCVSLWMVDGNPAYHQGTATVSATMRKVIYSDEASLNVAYVEQLDYEAYTPDLLGVIAWELAARTAGPLQNKTEGVVMRLQKKARDALIEAQSGEFGAFVDDDAFVSGFAELRLSAG
jgi:hypothetical protein